MGGAEVRFQIRSDVVTHDIDEGLLVVNLDTGKTWKLNHVGAAVCRGLEQGADVPRIAAELAARYGVPVETIRRDIDTLVADLHKEGLVEPLAVG
jgi:hypothetical protein